MAYHKCSRSRLKLARLSKLLLIIYQRNNSITIRYKIDTDKTDIKTAFLGFDSRSLRAGNFILC